MRTILSLLLIPTRPRFRDGFSRSLALLAAALCLAVSPQVLAQEAEAEAQEEAEAEAEAEEEEEPIVFEAGDDIEEVVVTGSRLKRDTYSSVAPLQVITAEVSREAGLIDATEIVQKSAVSAGAQIDVTFEGFVLDDGPGTETANLRGLGAARTLLLINGRRMGPAGVEGAPSSPDLGLIPGSLVQQYDLLLDGASSVYGSDAVAGVLNVILRKDFDGLEIDVFPRRPSRRGGDQDILTLAWGRNFDRGFIGVGAEYYSSDPVTYDDRPWTAGCRRHVEVDEGGTRRHQEQYWTTVFGMDWDDCASGARVGRVQVPLLPDAWVFHTPGESNGGWPDFSAARYRFSYRFGIDGDGDGKTDISYRDYDLNGNQQYARLYGESRTSTLMTFGEYTLEGDMNLTPYFELGYVEDDYYTLGGEPQLFPWVPAGNPYNICNPNGVGVDCGLAFDALLTNPHYVSQFYREYAAPICAQFGIPPEACTPAGVFGQTRGPIGPQRVRPVVSVRGDRNSVDRYLEQFRYVLGIEGDLPVLNIGGLSNWTFDFAFVHTRSDGSVFRPGIREDRLSLAIGDYSTTGTPCENNTETPMAFDTASGCVPVNMFAPSLYSPIVGDFATQAERNYVFDDRDFATEYRQTILSYYMTGALFQLPAGGVDAGFGVEYREDQITSIPGPVARDGLFFGFFSDGGAVGEKYTQEVFGEVELPILANQIAATELTLNLSARWTDDQYHGSAWTGSAKLAWRPIDSLLIRATGGTSFRAPNLRELFLQAQTGFLNVFDPCLVPGDALDAETGEYDSAGDDREQYVLDNCRATGVDPLAAHNRGFNVYNVEVAAGGSLTLAEETSESITAGFAWQQPFTNAFELTLGASYYKIEIENTIIEPNSGFIVNNCYYSRTGTSPFCRRITRGPIAPDGTGPRIDYLDIGFINRDNETVRGLDFNIAFDATVTVFDRPIELGLDINGHRTIERSELFVDDEGIPDFAEDQRTWYYGEYRGQTILRADYDRWGLTWTTRYVGAMDQPPEFRDEFDEAITGFSDTCLGPPDDLLCKDVENAPSYMVHSVSGRYRGDSWQVSLGASNVFDTPPPQINEGSTLVNNTPIGAGYDLGGRTIFLGVSMRLFGGE